MNKQEYMEKLYEALSCFDEEIRNEIISDYEEHFAMGLENGKSEEQIVAELGSIEDLVEEIKALKNEKSTGSSSKGKGFEFDTESIAKGLNDVAKGFASFLGSMAANLTKGAEKVSDSVSNGADSFADDFVKGFETVSDKVVEKTTKFAKEVSDSYKAARSEEDSDADEPVENENTDEDSAASSGECRKLVVDTDCGIINLSGSNTDKVNVEYINYGTANQKLAYRFNSYQKGSTFYVEVKRQPGTSNFFRSLTCPRIEINVEIPTNLEKIELCSASGAINVSGIEVKDTVIHGVSGAISIDDSKLGDFDCKNVSGKISFDNCEAGEIKAKAVSGCICINANATKAKADNTSGRVEISGSGYEAVSVSTISGAIDIDLKECSGFAADTSSVSGLINLKCGDSVIKGSRSGKYVLGEVSAKIKANSISGGISVSAQ